MPLKQWDHTDFHDDAARAKHKERSMEHWRACFHIWFWLSGPGSACGSSYTENGKHWNADAERRIARRDLNRYGWNISTVNSAHDFAVRNGPATTTPPCTIERDYPERWDRTESQRVEMREEAFGRISSVSNLARDVVIEQLDTTSDVDEWLRS